MSEKENVISEKKDDLSKDYIRSVLVYFICVLLMQMTFSDMWSGELKKIDLFELIIAPASCFAIAGLMGWYKNVFTTILSGISVCLFGFFFYMTFQKFTFFKGTSYEVLFNMNAATMSFNLIQSVILGTIILAFMKYFSKNKKESS